MLLAFQLLPARTADTVGVLLFGLAGAVIRVSRLGDALVATLVLAAASVVAVTQTQLSDAIASRWVRSDVFPDSGVGAVVVTSAAVNPNQTISSEALDHLITGIELIHAGSGSLLVTTTVQQRFPGGMVTSAADQARILALFGRQVRWIRTPPGQSTRDEAVQVASLLLPQGIRHVAVVASSMHTRRACSAFERTGFVVTCVSARSRSFGGGAAASPRDRLIVFGSWAYEIAATVKYRLRGWVGNRPSPRTKATASAPRVPVARALQSW